MSEISQSPIERDQAAAEHCFDRAREIQFLLDMNAGSVTERDIYDHIEELDRLYPFYGQEVWFTGQGMIGEEFDLGAQRMDILFEQMLPAQHTGFMVLRMPVVGSEEEYAYEVLQCLTVQYEEGGVSVMLPLDNVPVVGAAVNEAFEKNADGDEQIVAEYKWQEAKRHAEQVSQVLHHAGFYKLKREDQLAVINGMLQEAEEATQLRGLEFTGNPAIIWCVGLEDEEQVIELCDVSDLIVTGECMGLDCLETITLAERHVSGMDDFLLEGDAGLCLVVSPDETTCDRLGTDQRQLYIPLTQKFFVDFKHAGS